VKRYSSGMFVRLAFAVAAHLEPEILVIDEVLAVGDAAFQKKCLGKMQDVATQGRTVLFVSHNMQAVQALCPRAIMLEGGRVATTGNTNDVLARYLAAGGEDSHTWTRPANAPGAPLQFESASLRLHGTDRLEIELALRGTGAHRPAFVAVDLLDALGHGVMQALPQATPFIADTCARHSLRIDIELPPLIPGHYPISLWVGPHFTEAYDVAERALGFDVEQSPTAGRSYQHSPDHGHVVPRSTVTYTPLAESSAA